MNVKNNREIEKAFATIIPNQKPKRKTLIYLTAYKLLIYMQTANDTISRVRRQPTWEKYLEHTRQKTHFLNVKMT